MPKLVDFRDDSYTATYCPADDKLRLYTGRVPRECYDILRKLGFVATPKQECDFAAVWTVSREDACLALIPEWADIEDEDTSPADRAADRAERFAMYRDKRRDEATDYSDRYSEGPTAFGNQNQRRAERAAEKHERLKHKGVTQWGKAEYWQQRTAGVIANALHRLDPKTRRGRILEIEKEIRGRESSIADCKKRWDMWVKLSEETDIEKQNKWASALSGTSTSWIEFPHPDDGYEDTLWSLLERPTDGRRPITGAEAAKLYLEHVTNPYEYTDRWLEHLKLRLEYEESMLANEGGKASEVEMEVGGWIGKHQIHGINRSTATGRVTSVKLMAPKPWWRGEGDPPLTLQSFNIERFGSDIYRPPTDEEREAFKASKEKEKKAKKEAKKAAPPAPKLLNPTLQCAQRLQAIWNERNSKWHSTPKEVREMTQAEYSARREVETVLVGHDGKPHKQNYQGYRNNVPVFKVRECYGSVVVLTDKPQKPLPWEDMENIEESLISAEEIEQRLQEVKDVLQKCVKEFSGVPTDKWDLIERAVQLGYAFDESSSQKGLTDKGYEALNANMEPIAFDELVSRKVNFRIPFLVDSHEEIASLYKENQEKVERDRVAGTRWGSMSSYAIKGTGWYALAPKGENEMYVCTQRMFIEATKGEMANV